MNSRRSFGRLVGAGEQRQRHYIMPSAFVVLRFIISNFCGPLLTTARLSSFRPLQADGMDYGSATKTGI